MIEARGFLTGSLTGFVIAMLLVGGIAFYQQTALAPQRQLTEAQASSMSGPNTAAGIQSVPGTQDKVVRSNSPPHSNSLLSALPTEGAGAFAATVSPLLVGLILAALVYGFYLRRQNSR